METTEITLKTKTAFETEAVKAFLKALKIKHTLKTSDTKMTKDEYFAMLNIRIQKSKAKQAITITPENQKEILFGK